jgi:hypothetical protein
MTSPQQLQGERHRKWVTITEPSPQISPVKWCPEQAEDFLWNSKKKCCTTTEELNLFHAASTHASF